MTIRNLYPAQRPSIIYNVINGRAETPAQGTFTREGERCYWDQKGNLQRAATDVPRFDYDPLTGEFNGLLLEAEAKNYCPNDPPVYTGTTATEVDSKRGIPFYSVETSEFDSGYINTKSLPRDGNLQVSVFVDTTRTLSNNIRLTMFQQTVSNADAYFNIVDGKITIERTQTSGVWADPAALIQDCGDGLYRIGLIARTAGGGNYGFRFYIDGEKDLADDSWQACVGAPMWIKGGSYGMPSVIFEAQGPQQTVGSDLLTLTAVSNYDNGFSLLLDSEATTPRGEFIYKIKAGETEVASLSNDQNTLSWVINGKSAEINGDYPQVGFTFGRVRTISSFGPSGQGDVDNFLYTTGLSFPTAAEPAAGANDIVFGVAQTLKALYVWDGQLDPVNAVSLIRGKYNVVENKKPEELTYSFIFDTDPTSKNIASGQLDVRPNDSMTVLWGDGNTDTLRSDVVPSHTWPYPGRYRVQTTAADGYRNIKPSSVQDAVVNIEQWPPEYRVGATGPGFTDDDLMAVLYQQRLCQSIPAFKYSGLTSLHASFNGCSSVSVKSTPEADDWDWVPTNIPEVTSVYGCFTGISSATGMTDSQRESFPQLQTSGALVNVASCFSSTTLRKFPDGLPFSDTSGVGTWDSCFAFSTLQEIGPIDTSACTNFANVFRSCVSLKSLPNFIANSMTTMSYAFEKCSGLTQFPQINSSACEDFMSTWSGCQQLESFPNLSFNSATTINSAWQGCSSLIGFPFIEFPLVEDAGGAWQGCSDLERFPQLSFPSCTGFTYAWRNCAGLSEFPEISTPSAVRFFGTWRDCTGFTSFPDLDFTGIWEVSEAWYNCTGFTEFNADLDFSEIVKFNNTWGYCIYMTTIREYDFTGGEEFAGAFSRSGLTSFPNTGDCFPNAWAFASTWAYTDLTAFPAIQFTAAKDMRNAWGECTNLTTFEAGCFDNTGALEDYAFNDAWKNCALTAGSIENILVSLDANGATGIEVGLDGGSNADKATWTEAANTAYDSLIGKGWDISMNDAGRSAGFTTSSYYVNHENGRVAFGKHEPGVVHVSGKANQELYETVTEAVARVLSINRDYFPVWEPEMHYEAGSFVRCGSHVRRALRYIDSFQTADIFDCITTSEHRQPTWEIIFVPGQQEQPASLVAEEVRERRRARNADGTFRADDPRTPDVNEAWE